MLEQGFVQLLQSNGGVAAIALGGWRNQLPEDAPLPNWSYLSILKRPQYALQALPGLCEWRVQIDCYSASDQGQTSAAGIVTNQSTSVDLANAIYGVLSGFRGTLPDPQNTQVDSAFLVDEHSEFDSVRRTWRTLQEWQLWYYVSPSNPPD